MFSRNRVLLAGFIFFLILALFFGNHPFFRFFRKCVQIPAYSLLKAGSFFTSDLLSLSRAENCIEENRLLKKKLITFQHDQSLLQEKLSQSKRIESLLAFQNAHPETSGLFCHIVGRDPSHWSQTILLDRGRREGMKEDMAVLGMKGLVGRVIEADDEWSKALLITDPDSKVGAMLERSREVGLLVGESRGLLVMEYLSPDADVREGDEVLTAGFGETFPKGIIIGKVVGFGRREDTLFLYALVKPAERLSQLEEVLCVTR